MSRPTPKHKAPELNFPLLNGGHWELKEQHPENFTLIVFYRGLHCPVWQEIPKNIGGAIAGIYGKGSKCSRR